MPAPRAPAPPRQGESAPPPARGTGPGPRAAAGSTRRIWLLAGALSLSIHLAVGLTVLMAEAAPPGLLSTPALPPPVMVTLIKPPPPPPPPEPEPGPAADAASPAAPPARARPTPPAPTPRPSRAPVPPLEVETLAARIPAPPAPMATLSDAQLAGATVAGSGDGPGGSGAAGGTGTGAGGCDMVRRLQDALRDDPEVRAAVTRAQGEVGPGRALLVWNGDWIRNPGEAGEGLAGVRQAIAMEVAFAPSACRASPMRGLVLIAFSDAPGGARLVLGRGAWRWGDMLRGR